MHAWIIFRYKTPIKLISTYRA